MSGFAIYIFVLESSYLVIALSTNCLDISNGVNETKANKPIFGSFFADVVQFSMRTTKEEKLISKVYCNEKDCLQSVVWKSK